MGTRLSLAVRRVGPGVDLPLFRGVSGRQVVSWSPALAFSIFLMTATLATGGRAAAGLVEPGDVGASHRGSSVFCLSPELEEVGTRRDGAPTVVAAAPSIEGVDLLPAGFDRSRVTRSLSRNWHASLVLHKPDAALIDALRWCSPDPAAAFCAETGARLLEEMGETTWITPPDDTGALFDAYLNQAEQQILFLDLDGALASLAHAEEMAPCMRQVVQPDRLRDLFLLEGVAHVYLEDGREARSFAAALAIDPGLELGTDYSEQAHEALREAKAKVSGAKAVAIPRVVSNADLFLDGKSLDARHTVLPGRHLLQATSVFGDVRTQWVQVGAGGGESAVARVDTGGVWDVWGALWLLSDAQAVTQFVGELSGEALSPPTRAALDRYIGKTGCPFVVFLWPRDGDPAAGVYRVGSGLKPMTRDLAKEIVERCAPRSDAGGRGVQIEVSVAQAKRGSGPWFRVDAGVTTQVVLGDPAMFAANGRAFGYGISLAFRFPASVVAGLHVRWLPHVHVAPGEGVCGPPDSGTATREQVACAAGTLPVRSLLGLGVSMGYVVFPTHRFSVTPSVEFAASHLPNTLVDQPEIDPALGGYVVADAWMAGPSVRFRAGFMLVSHPFPVHLFVVVAGGALVGRVGDETITGFPTGIEAGAGANF